jgi:trehalose 6-phosphate phosphatase
MRLDPVLAFEFDGTLAPTVPEPSCARLPTPVTLRMQRVAARWPVAIFTGRSVRDVRARLPFVPWRVIGSHGAESGAGPRSQRAAADLEIARQLLRRHDAEWRALGVVMEDKGASIALHYRFAEDRHQALRTIADVLRDLPPALRVFGGKFAANIVAEWASDKVRVLTDLEAESGSKGIVFVGDDDDEEDVFARQEPTWLTVRVGPNYPNSQAAYALEGAQDLPRMLDLVLHSID